MNFGGRRSGLVCYSHAKCSTLEQLFASETAKGWCQGLGRDNHRQLCLHRGVFPGAGVTGAKSGDRMDERHLEPMLLITLPTLT